MFKNEYLTLADQGKNAWWRYGAGILLVLSIWMVGSALLTVPLQESGLAAPGSVLEFALGLLTFGLMLLGVWLATAWLHRRSFGSLVGPGGRLSGRRLLFGAAIWTGLSLIATASSVIFEGTRYTLNPNFAQSWPYLLVALILIPLQTSAEEFFFRGYLLQATGRLTQNPLVLSAVNGVLFTLPHLANPEAEQFFALAILDWFLVGAGWTLITLRSGSLDYALGMHAIGNLLLTILLGYEGGALPAVSLLVTSAPPSPYGILTLCASLVVSYWIISRVEPGSRKGRMSVQEAARAQG
ncbi:MAG: CPBP family intramembrane metalloprotease [Anaerolineae bacterium]|nr:CPBP family intramembrane metalloprotease [Anaerolineae bacterium]